MKKCFLVLVTLAVLSFGSVAFAQDVWVYGNSSSNVYVMTEPTIVSLPLQIFPLKLKSFAVTIHIRFMTTIFIALEQGSLITLGIARLTTIKNWKF